MCGGVLYCSLCGEGLGSMIVFMVAEAFIEIVFEVLFLG